MAREAGANNIYFASAAPPIRHPNVYGIDMPTRQELIATDCSEAEIGREIGADHIIFQELDALEQCISKVNPSLKSFETSCFDGKYITGDVTPDYLSALESQRNDGLIKLQRKSSTQLDLSFATMD
jgi:amidophosphoribosyltransferase